MSKISLLIQKTHEQAKLPQYANPGDACFDLQWQPAPGSIPGHVARYGLELTPGQCLIFRTGLKMAFPAGYVLKIFSRSGHGFKHQVSLANGTGIIDSGFRGELQVALINHSNISLVIFKPGDRIAQAMLVKLPEVEMQEVKELPESVRGESGFGSTGTAQLPLIDSDAPLETGEADALPMPPALREDGGCQMHGVPHVCLSK